MFSSRTNLSTEPNEFSRRLNAIRASGRELLDLTCSNPTRVGLPEDPQLLAELSSPSALRYDPCALGLLDARRAVAAEFARTGTSLAPDSILLTASTSEAYAFLFKLLTEPGDEILVPRPSYPLFEHLTQLESLVSVPYELRYDGSWYLDLDSIQRAITARTKAIVVVSPNNPTGSCLRRKELTRLASLGLPLISDEVFADYRFDDSSALMRTALEQSETLTFALGGLSKSLALPQLKLAWIGVGGPETLRRAALERLDLIADTYLSVSTPIQLALAGLLRRGTARRQAVQVRLAYNLAQAKEVTRDTAVTPLQVDGGWTLPLRLPRTRSEESWVYLLLEQAGVLVQPGWFFDFREEAFAIVSLLSEPSQFRRGLERLIERVDD